MVLTLPIEKVEAKGTLAMRTCSSSASWPEHKTAQSGGDAIIRSSLDRPAPTSLKENLSKTEAFKPKAEAMSNLSCSTERRVGEEWKTHT